MFRRLSPKSLIVCSALLIAVIATGLWLVFKSNPAKNSVIPSANPLNNKTQAVSSAGSNTSDSQTTSQDNQSSAGPNNDSGPAPISPYGNFVSNHHPGGSLSTSEASTCNTSAGASCYIQFKQGSTVKRLDAQVTNANGAAIWSWDVKTAGLTPGSWTISAVASMNGQTKTANDSQPLVVQ